jgi:uncharacterized protein (TIGR02246 family)
MALAFTPEEINVRWGEAFQAGDLAGMLDLYEDDAVLVPQPGAEPISGLDAIEANLQFLISLRANISYEPRFWMQRGELAVGSIAFHITDGTTPDGEPFEIRGVTSEVARRQTDGTWKYVFDHPFTDSTP